MASQLQQKPTAQDIEALEDLRIIMVARAQGAYGVETAKRHASALLESAMVAYAAGNLSTAIWYTQREVEFNRRAFGLSHAFTRSSSTCLKALRRQEKAVHAPEIRAQKHGALVA